MCPKPGRKHPTNAARCVFWFPDPDSTDYEYLTVGDFTPYQRITELAPHPTRRPTSLSEQPESSKAGARQRRSSSRSALPLGLGLGAAEENQSKIVVIA